MFKYKLRSCLNSKDWVPCIKDTYPEILLEMKNNNHYDEELFYKRLYQSGCSLIGYQCARLTEKEINDILKLGLSFGGKKLLYSKISSLPENYSYIKATLKKHVDDLFSTQADDLIYFSYGFLDLDNDTTSCSSFLNNWGGESIYNYYDNGNIILDDVLENMKVKLSEISHPCIIIVRCPLKIEYDLQFKYFYDIFMSQEIKTISSSMCINKYKPEVIDIVDLSKYAGLDYS
jgi:hypothetical protein